jgi:acyl-[acyl carrier protein]--UDP-N-acetylglucosamine O-acyltransferase
MNDVTTNTFERTTAETHDTKYKHYNKVIEIGNDLRVQEFVLLHKGTKYTNTKCNKSTESILISFRNSAELNEEVT